MLSEFVSVPNWSIFIYLLAEPHCRIIRKITYQNLTEAGTALPKKVSLPQLAYFQLEIIN